MLGLDGSYEGQDMTAVPYHPDLKYLGFFLQWNVSSQISMASQ